jgi:hypothetical protein
MASGYKRIKCIPGRITAVLMLCLLVLMFSGCSDNKEPSADKRAQDASESFTFFDLGRNSRYSESVRKNLSRQLGNDAIEKRGLLNLEINYYGFLQEHYPALHTLNVQLNPSSGERIEHNISRLMYRYARKKNLPFDFVELTFSNYSQLPLVFKIDLKEDETSVVQTLETKYGEPQRVDWQNKNGQSMYWEQNGDRLFVSLVPDQFGNPKYQIRIFFVNNIQALLEQEKIEKENQELRRTKSGQKAF